MSTLAKAIAIPSIGDDVAEITQTVSLLRSAARIKTVVANKIGRPASEIRECLENALSIEVRCNHRRAVINQLKAALKNLPALTVDDHIKGYEKAARIEYGLPEASNNQLVVLSPESLLPGADNAALSPLQASALAAVEAAWTDAARLAGLVKNYARAGTAAKALCGLRLRALREHYCGPRSAKGGRPKKSEADGTWTSLLADRLGVDEATAWRWIKMADSVEALAEHQNLDLRTTCEKLPWDWTPEEAAMIDATVHALCEDKTQRQLLQADFLSDLGYESPEKPNSSNNPFGKNGGKKKPASSPAALRAERQAAVRLIFLGTEKAGRVEKGSVAMFMTNFVNTDGIELEALPQAELRDLYEHTVKPFAAAFRKLAGL